MSGMIGRVDTAQVRREMIRMNGRASRKRFLIGAVVVLAVALLVGEAASRFLFTLADIRTRGMSPALRSGDVALCERMDSPLRKGQPQLTRGALALVAYDDSGLRREAVRRVIAVAGDEVSVGEDGAVTLNGEPLDESYAAYRDQSDWSGDDDTPGGALENPFLTPDEAAALAPTVEAEPGVDDVVFPITVPEGKLFVLCDDRDDAMDSRSSRFGLVSEQDVLGLARAIIWPAHRAGLLTGGGIE